MKKQEMAKRMSSYYKGKKGKGSLLTAKGGRNEGEHNYLGPKDNEEPKA